MTVVPGTEGAMKLFKVLGFASLLAAMIAFVAPVGAFTSGGWEGQANHDEDGTFRDCTMTADYANGITLAFIISRDFGWGLVKKVVIADNLAPFVDRVFGIAATALFTT